MGILGVGSSGGLQMRLSFHPCAQPTLSPWYSPRLALADFCGLGSGRIFLLPPLAFFCPLCTVFRGQGNWLWVVPSRSVVPWLERTGRFKASLLLGVKLCQNRLMGCTVCSCECGHLARPPCIGPPWTGPPLKLCSLGCWSIRVVTCLPWWLGRSHTVDGSQTRGNGLVQCMASKSSGSSACTSQVVTLASPDF